MDDPRFGLVVRTLRHRKGWRQQDLARAARLSESTIVRVEHGRLGGVRVETLRDICRVLEVSVEIVPRWRGGELARLMNSRHNAMGEAVIARLGLVDGWRFVPEVSFAIWGERGVIDILGWHEGTQTLLIIELKTEIVDPQELIATMDRRERLASAIAHQRGWQPNVVATWVVVLDGPTNRRRVAQHASLLRAAFPSDGRSMRSWLTRPRGSVAALSFWLEPVPDRAGGPRRARSRAS